MERESAKGARAGERSWKGGARAIKGASAKLSYWVARDARERVAEVGERARSCGTAVLGVVSGVEMALAVVL